MSYYTVKELKDAFIKLYGNRIVEALKTGNRIAEINNRNMVSFSIDKETVDNFLFSLREEQRDEI